MVLEKVSTDYQSTSVLFMCGEGLAYWQQSVSLLSLIHSFPCKVLHSISTQRDNQHGSTSAVQDKTLVPYADSTVLQEFELFCGEYLDLKERNI
jgi:hypothetical protein